MYHRQGAVRSAASGHLCNRQQIDKRLAAWNKEKSELDARLADPELYTGQQAAEVPALKKRQAELVQRIEDAELRWLELHETLDAIPAD